jgi:hypothetical protein
MTFTPQQAYKNRASAFRLFIQAQGLPVSERKFYNDAHRLGLVRQDKTIELAALLAYVNEDLKINPATGQSLVARDTAQEKEAAELRHIQLKNDKLARENRADDERWLLKEDAHAQMAAIVGLLRDSLRHHAHRAAAAIIHLAGGEVSRAPEVYEGVEEEILSRAFNEVAGAGRVEVMFAGGEE